MRRNLTQSFFSDTKYACFCYFDNWILLAINYFSDCENKLILTIFNLISDNKTNTPNYCASSYSPLLESFRKNFFLPATQPHPTTAIFRQVYIIDFIFKPLRKQQNYISIFVLIFKCHSISRLSSCRYVYDTYIIKLDQHWFGTVMVSV